MQQDIPEVVARLVSVTEVFLPVALAFSAAQSLIVSGNIRSSLRQLFLLAGLVLTYLAKSVAKNVLASLLGSTGFRGIMLRPVGAPSDCDGLCLVLGTCPQHSELTGFPSGHTATLVFFLTAQFLDNPNAFGLFFYSMTASFISATRITRGCHTFAQVLGGAMLGVLMAAMFHPLQHVLVLYCNHYLQRLVQKLAPQRFDK